MQLSADEISSIIKKQIQNFDRAAMVSETGTVLSTGDGIARIYGLEGVMAGELVEFPGSVGGNAFAAFGNQNTDLGTYFGVDAPGNLGSYTTVLDPQCFDSKQVVQVDGKGFGFARDAGGCNLRALAQRVPIGTPGSFLLNSANPNEIAAHYVLVNPKPGEYGVLTPNVLTRFGNWSFDANIQKSLRISESKQISIRIDAKNVLNHPEPFIPLFSTNDVAISQFGVIECGCGDSKSGTRTFQGQLRFTF